MVENKHSVSKRQWKKWNEQEQYLFNSVYDQMMLEPLLFQHPDWATPQEYWTTTAWNAAWIAADDLKWLRKND